MEKVAATLLFLLYLSSAQQEHCGSIGNDNEAAATLSRNQFFYLNTANPANCTGNVTSWRVCYYGPENIDVVGSYWATYAVYRRVRSQTEDESITLYTRVSDIFRAIRTVSRFTNDPMIDGEIVEGGFNCYTDSIESPLTIQAGDILGACVFTPESTQSVVNRFPLDVVGETSTGETLLYNVMGTAGCSREAIPSNISSNQLLTFKSRRLHIYANIDTITGTNYSQAATRKPSTSTVLPSHTSIANPSTLATVTGSHVSQVVAIAAGSAGGGLLVLLLLSVALISTIVCLASQKRKANNSSSSSQTINEYFNKPAGDKKFTTESNVAYKSVVHTETASADFEIMHESTEQKQSTESQVSKLDMEQNVEYYESSNTAQISLSSNAAYCEFGRQPEENVYENDVADDQYDYI